MKILVVDDEPAIVQSLEPVLAAHGHSLSTAATAADALRQARDGDPELVLLDLGLPDGDGLEIIARLKSLGDATIIVLSARHLEQDKVTALDEGADDYVDKPFGIGELLARIRAAERRRQIRSDSATQHFASGDLSVDFATRRVELQGEEVKLSPKEFALLSALCRSAGQVVTQRKLLIAGWDDPTTDSQNLRAYIALLRQKLEYDPSVPEMLLTEPGVGYRLALLPG